MQHLAQNVQKCKRPRENCLSILGRLKKDTRDKQEKNKCRSREKSVTIGKKQSVVANAIEKSNQIITEASILFCKVKAIISDSVNIFDSMQQ